MNENEFYRVKLFSKNQEYLNLCLPIIALFAIGIQLIMGGNFTPTAGTWGHFLPAIVGGGHVCFTFLYLNATIEGRNLTNGIFFKSRLRFVFAITVLLFIVSYFSFIHFFNENNMATNLAKGLLLFLWAQHALGQMRGLSFLYNQKMRVINSFSISNLMRIDKVERIEKCLHYGMLLSWIFQAFSFEYLSEKNSTQILSALFIFPILILVNSFLYPMAIKSNKSIYLVRLFLFPLAIICPFAGLAIYLIHGAEYELILFKMLNGSKAKIPVYSLVIILVFLFIYYPIINYARYLKPYFPHDMLIGLSIFTLSINYFHYYVDMIIFRFRDPIVRESFQQVLLKKV
jgi:hypothetical protein